MARILCIEDSQEYQIYLSAILKDYTMTFASSGGRALSLTENGRDHFDLVLLDVSLPDGNGLKILPRLKESMGPRFVPVIIISADSDIVTKIAAFGVGADDYVSKPADPNELRMRIEARLRAVQFIASEKHTVSFGNIKMDIDKMNVEIQTDSEGPAQVELTPYEFKILKLLLSRPKQVYTREVIIDQVWGIDKFITSRTVDAHISHLRKKLSASDISIETVLGTGYKIELKDRIAA